MNRIYYFSGTGNTLAAAKYFASKLGDTELISIADLERGEDVDFSFDGTIGIFCPVYCFGLPHIVCRFVDRIVLSDPSKKPYVYSFCTCGGMKGSASMILADRLENRGLELNAAFHVTMPSNYIPLTPPLPKRRVAKMIVEAKAEADKFVKIVKARKNEKELRLFPFDAFGELVAKSAVSYLDSYDKYFWLTDSCDGCGLCSKLCPASNIIMMNNLPTWRGHCEQCMACLQWCPKQAIQYKQVTQKRGRYHNPEVTADEMIRTICK